ncbi:MAG: mechanosensitive ion channel [Bacteroidales bacterium]|nr:mechanosensitive ion channel [Bacteroidales bacterium]
MSFKNFLDNRLFKAGEVSITVFHLFEIILILVITYILIRLIKKIIHRQEVKKRMEIGQLYAIYQIIKYFLWIIAIVIILDTLEVKVTILLASSAALLVGLGLGLQQIFQDFVSGVALLFEGTIKVSDIVEIEGSIVGRVREIGIRTSKIETRDNIIMIVPNSKFISDNVINWSHLEKKTRFSVKVGVSYGSDVILVTEVLLKCARDHKEITTDPSPFVRFTDFGESSLDFELFFWSTETFRVENIKSELRYEIFNAFARNKIQIPFPQRDVHIRSGS